MKGIEGMLAARVCPPNRLSPADSRRRQNHALRLGFVQSVNPTKKLVMTASRGMSKRALKQSEIFTPFQPCFVGFLNFYRFRARCSFNASSFSMVIHSFWPDDLRTLTKF